MTERTVFVDGLPVRLAGEFDLSFLARFGTVFKVYDAQDSGNLCFGVQKSGRKVFVKLAGAPTVEYTGTPEEAVKRLKEALPVYRALRHPSLIPLLEEFPVPGGYAAVFGWAEGVCMGRMYPSEHARVMALPIPKKLALFDDVLDFMAFVADSGWAEVDFYDGSILYDEETGKTTVCDVDFFRPAPFVNDMGQMWGSARFLAPEEYEKGAVIDRVTNVFTAGRMAFSLFTDSDFSKEAWPLNGASYDAARKACAADRSERYPSIAAFAAAWHAALKK